MALRVIAVAALVAAVVAAGFARTEGPFEFGGPSPAEPQPAATGPAEAPASRPTILSPAVARLLADAGATELLDVGDALAVLPGSVANLLNDRGAVLAVPQGEALLPAPAPTSADLIAAGLPPATARLLADAGVGELAGADMLDAQLAPSIVALLMERGAVLEMAGVEAGR